jgi:hypothetical protein
MGDLATLIATERRLDDELRAAKAEADRILAEARRLAAAPPAAVAADDPALRAADAAAGAELDAELARVAEELARQLALYVLAEATRVSELADAVVAALVEEAEQPA